MLERGKVSYVNIEFVWFSFFSLNLVAKSSQASFHRTNLYRKLWNSLLVSVMISLISNILLGIRINVLTNLNALCVTMNKIRPSIYDMVIEVWRLLSSTTVACRTSRCYIKNSKVFFVLEVHFSSNQTSLNSHLTGTVYIFASMCVGSVDNQGK